MDEATTQFLGALGEEEFTATWILFNGDLQTPWLRLTFAADGMIGGGGEAAARWQCSEETFSIISEGGVLTATFDLRAAKSVLHLEGINVGSGGRYHLRRAGFLQNTTVGPCAVVVTDDQSFGMAWRDKHDFSVLAFPSGDVAPELTYSFRFDAGSHRAGRCSRSAFDIYPQYAAPPVYFHVLHQCDLVGGTVVVDKTRQPIFDTTYQAELRSRFAATSMCEVDEKAAILMNRHSPDKIIAGTTIAFSTLWENFGHWHTQTLPSVYIVDLLNRIGTATSERVNLLILRGPKDEAFRDESLALLGLGGFPVINPAENSTRDILDLRFERLVVPSILRVPDGERWNPGLITYLRNRMRERIGKVPNRRRRLFVSRKDVLGRRGLENEGEVFAQLEPLGFEAFVPSDYGYVAQLEAFAESECIVSPHGGALTSMLAAQSGLIVFELFHTRQLNCWYRNLAFICGHQYHGICGLPVDPASTAHWNSAFRIDEKSLARVVDSVLRK